MKRKIIISLLALFLISTSGALFVVLNMTDTTETLSWLIKLHQIEDLRKQLHISIHTVQSDLYTVHTQLSKRMDAIVENVAALETSAAKCGNCHHEPDVAARIRELQDLLGAYQNALSIYITASANRQRIAQFKNDAAGIGNQLLMRTEAMSAQAGQKLEAMTVTAMDRIRTARIVLFITMAVTLSLSALVAVHLTRSVTRPIQTLVDATRAISSGDMHHTVTIPDDAEFSELAGHFNAMSVALRENYEVLAQEIRGRERAEEALMESDERFLIAQMAVKVGAWDWDLISDRIVLSNEYYQLYGLPRDIATSSERWLLTIHPDDRDTVKSYIEDALKSKNDINLDFRAVRPDGEVRWLNAIGQTTYDHEGRPIRMIGVNVDITDRKRSEEALKNSEENLRRMSNRILTAHEEERQRISRELHDQLGQDLTLAKFQIRSLQQFLPDDLQAARRDEFGQIVKLLDQIIENTRRISRDLSPAVLEDLGLTVALRRLTATFAEKYQIAAEAVIPNIDVVTGEARIMLYRILQEALTNIARHARAHTVHIAIGIDDQRLSFSVTDDGIGFDLKEILGPGCTERGLGLRIMDERVRVLGGSLVITSNADRGTAISFSIPLKRA